jgi:ferredoxin
MKVFYFSSTGNCLSVAKALGGEAISIPQVLRGTERRFEDDAIGIVTPTYCGNPARIVVEFLEQVELFADYRFAIATYGGLMGNPLKPLAAVATKKGWSFDYTNAILMVDNYLPFFDIDQERQKKDQRKIDAEVDRVAGDIATRKQSALKPSVPMKLYGAVAKVAYNGIAGPGVAHDKFSVNESCTSCGTCARFCPGDNIVVAPNARPVFRNSCLGCYGCVHICPQNAIHAKGEKSAARWRNPDASVDELIAANTQQ